MAIDLISAGPNRSSAVLGGGFPPDWRDAGRRGRKHRSTILDVGSHHEADEDDVDEAVLRRLHLLFTIDSDGQLFETMLWKRDVVPVAADLVGLLAVFINVRRSNFRKQHLRAERAVVNRQISDIEHGISPPSCLSFKRLLDDPRLAYKKMTRISKLEIFEFILKYF